MPDIRQESTIQALAQAFCNNDRCQEKAMVSVGYTKAYANSYCGKMWENVQLLEAIKAIDDQRQAEYKHNYDIAVSLLRTDYAALQARAEQGDIQAIQARTAIIRELDSITGLHSQTINTADTTPKPLTEQEQAELKALAALATNLQPQGQA